VRHRGGDRAGLEFMVITTRRGWGRSLQKLLDYGRMGETGGRKSFYFEMRTEELGGREDS
jgi:hypothetical protein